MVNGILYRKADTSAGDRLLVVPKGMREDVILAAHHAPTAGHMGFKRTFNKVRARYWWRGMKESIKLVLAECSRCNARNGKSNRKVPLSPMERTGEPFRRIGIDFMTLPLTKNRNKYLLVVVDHASKWVEATATQDETAATAATFVFDEIVCRHGCPSEIVSDRGKAFVSEVFKALAGMCGFERKYTSGYHPQTNGLTERMNRTFENMLAKRVSSEQDDWDKYVRAACWAYNTSTHSATGYTPYEMLYGRLARLPLDAQVIPALKGQTAEEWFRDTVWKKELILRNGLSNQQRSASQQAQAYNKKTRKSDFEEGDIVRWYRPTVALGKSTKLA